MSLINKFRGQKRWVNWQYKTVDGKQTKMPIGKSNDPTTWSTYDELKDKKNVGIMFGLDKKFLGIDIDHCVENGKIVHEYRDEIVNFIKQSNTYVELSPSKTGIHLYFELTEPLELITNKKAPYEVYSSLRFFTVTGDKLGQDREVRTITPDEANSLLSLIRYPWGKDKKEELNLTQNVESLDDTELLKKMFNSKTGKKLEALYNGDISDYDNDDSNADMALCLSLAFWTRKDSNQMERIWLSSPLGQREKTQNRLDYRSRTIQNAISQCAEVYRTKVKTKISINEDETQDFDFLYTVTDKKTYVTLCLENVTEFLRKHPDFKDNFRFDNFKNYIEIREDGVWRQFLDIDAITLQAKISRMMYDFQKVSKIMVFDAIANVAKENEIDSAKDFVTSLVWDKVPRIDNWLRITYGVEDTEYHRKVGSNWLKGLIKRLVEPGCKFDHVLVLEGEQGTKKSTSLYVLGREWHLETTSSVESKDFFLLLQGKAIAEFSEGETLSRTEVKKMKSVISTCIDTYRSPYDRIVADHPRRCVFAMTTNESQYLKDDTGNRRWWPVKTVLEKANVEWLEENRNQLFAEAYYRVVKLDETAYEMPEEETKAMQDSRRISDPNTEFILDWYFDKLTEVDRQNGITVTQAFVGALGNEFNKNMKKYEEQNIANILKNVLKLEKKLCMRNTIQTNRWFPTGETATDVKTYTELEDNFRKL